MHKNPELVPTVITDVNGKTTTVYKKQQLASSASSMPAPKVSNVVAARQRVFDLIEEVSGEISENKKRSMRDYIREELSEETLPVIESHLRNGGSVAQGIVQQIIAEESETNILETLHYYTKLGIDDCNRVAGLVRSLYQYSFFAQYHDLTQVDEEVQSACVKVMTLTQILDTLPDALPRNDDNNPVAYDSNKDDWWVAVIKDRELLESVMTEDHDLHELASIITKHGTTKLNEIRGIREGILPALADGAL